MSKKTYIILLCFFILSSFGQVFSEVSYFIDTRDNKEIVVGSVAPGSKMRVLVEKDKDRYYYSLNRKEETLPLQLGKGNYSIKILENKSGNTYRVVFKRNIKVDKFDEKEAFLTSAQPIYWKGGQAEEIAENLTKNKKTTMSKVESIHNYIVKNIDYDYEKIKGLNDNYTPNTEETLKTKSGICYDYSALTAGMLRSLNIPTKLVKGYKNDLKTYHAWNEVLIDGKWVIIDTTYDAAFVKAGKKTSMIKSFGQYDKIREY